jgi:transcriptional regulator with XRE-family HTH domain
MPNSHIQQVDGMPKRGSRNFLAIEGPKETSGPSTEDSIKADFGLRLQRALIARGMTQSELAREVQTLMGKGRTFGRDNVSKYIRGHALPRDDRLELMAKVLKVKPEDLLLPGGRPTAAMRNPEFEVRSTGDGNSWVRINMSLPDAVAIEIMQLAKGLKKP